MATKERIISVVAISMMFLTLLAFAGSLGAIFAHASTTATFGNTNVGPYTDRTVVGDKTSVMYQAPANGIMTSVSMYIQTGNALVSYSVYTDLNGQPDQLVAQSVDAFTSGNSWVSAPIYAPIAAGQNYWLTVASNSVIYWNYDFGALAGNGKQASLISSPTYGEFTSWGTAAFSMYATYTPEEQPASAEAQPIAAAQPTPTTTSNMPAGLSLKASTDFETATVSGMSVNVGFKNSFQTEGNGGAAAWIEGLDRTSGVPVHSGNRALGMEVTDISQSRRNEFNVYSNDVGLSNQFYVSTYIYLPSDFTLRGGDGAYMDLFQVASNTGSACPMYSLMISEPHADGTFNIKLFVRDASASKVGNDGIVAQTNNFALPRGQWFHFEYYQVNSANGIAKAWINGQEVISYTGNTELIGNYFLSTDLYYNADDTTQHKMWVDDFAIYG